MLTVLTRAMIACALLACGSCAFSNIGEVHTSKAERLVLLTKRGRVPFIEHYSGIGRDEMAAQRAEVEAFVRQPGRSSLRIQSDGRRLAAVLGGVPLLLGLGCLVSAVLEYRRWRDA
jgi:hypothetical protein